MKVIIDECVPAIVARRLPQHNIVSVQNMGWAGIKNGQLLKLVAADFDVFIASDKISATNRISPHSTSR